MRWAWWWPPPPSEVLGWLDVDLWIPHLVPAASWGGAVAGENRGPTPVEAGDGDVRTLLPC
jgi:hypothetical protein